MTSTPTPPAAGSAGFPVYAMLGSRLILFLLFQVLIALFLNSWESSERYWLLCATLTNLVSIGLLVILFRREGIRFLSVFSFQREKVKKDLLLFAGIIVLALPVVFAPGYLLGKLLWGDADVPTALLFRPVESWLVYILLLAFPLTIAFAELATYFAYVMPRLQKTLRAKWLAVLLPVIFLSVQHCTLPFIPDLHFILYRALVFLPFALLIGVSVYFRPSLFVYFAIFHGVLDFGTAMMYLVNGR